MGQEPHLAISNESVRAQEARGIGRLFLWILSFGRAKESITLSGAGTRFKKYRRIATQLALNNK